jgi:hypothetical protein
MMGRPSKPMLKNNPVKPSTGKLLPIPELSVTRLYKSTSSITRVHDVPAGFTLVID